MMFWQLGWGCGVNAHVVVYPIAARRILGPAVDIIVADIVVAKEIGVGVGELLRCFLI